MEEFVVLKAYRRLQEIEFLKLQAVLSAIIGSSSSPPNYEDLKKLLTNLESLIFPVIKLEREDYLASSRKILDSYKGKILKVRPLDVKYELKDKVTKNGRRRR